MKRGLLKKKRVTVTMEPDLYAQFHRFAESRSWSDDKTGSQLIQACFKGSVYSLVQEETNPMTGRKFTFADFIPQKGA